MEKLPTAPYTRGVAVANGMVFIGTMDGRAIALDQKTGKEVWKTQLVDTMKCGCLFTSPPLAVKGKVIFGSTQGGIAARGGGIFGVDQKTGKKDWYFDPVLEGKEHWGTNSFGESSAKYAGVGAWHVGSYDPELDLVYWGTSNPSPWFDWAAPEDGPKGYLRKDGEGARPGDNLYASSVLALRPDTGELVWYHQEHPHDEWDFDATLGEFVLVNAGDKKLMIHQAKSGYVYHLRPHQWRSPERLDDQRARHFRQIGRSEDRRIDRPQSAGDGPEPYVLPVVPGRTQLECRLL